MGKRFVDAAAALTLLIILSPVIGFTALLIKKTMGGPVLFKQLRPGLHEELFFLYKFRTMTDETDEKGDLLPDSLRMTRAGAMIRRWSLDELPQLWNVLKGELSLVGPRPLLVEYLSEYTDEQRLRHTVKPGITGLAQISGRNNLSWEEKFAFDVTYASSRTFMMDMKILWLTFIKVLKREGIDQEGGVQKYKRAPHAEAGR
ncbi:sugar transferase [Alkalicoccus luteus]|uniref:Sugar transferase n=1 Tax=Alkalicoccus luteus TaxID=1237094 RepID=A0A969PTE8_9BACI|nr:sugar transferase [Alkalicoccus luteus]NJP38789.1 sugar transferase [Alkalicoccus luteus]